MSALTDALYSLVDSRKDNRTTIGVLLSIVAFWAKARGYIQPGDLPYALAFIATLTGVNVLSIAHEDHGKAVGAAATATTLVSQQETGSGDVKVEVQPVAKSPEVKA